jgi:hypothetical protein
MSEPPTIAARKSARSPLSRQGSRFLRNAALQSSLPIDRNQPVAHLAGLLETDILTLHGGRELPTGRREFAWPQRDGFVVIVSKWTRVFAKQTRLGWVVTRLDIDRATGKYVDACKVYQFANETLNETIAHALMAQ